MSGGTRSWNERKYQRNMYYLNRGEGKTPEKRSHFVFDGLKKSTSKGNYTWDEVFYGFRYSSRCKIYS
jgi:hypothetical protein